VLAMLTLLRTVSWWFVVMAAWLQALATAGVAGGWWQAAVVVALAPYGALAVIILVASGWMRLAVSYLGVAVRQEAAAIAHQVAQLARGACQGCSRWCLLLGQCFRYRSFRLSSFSIVFSARIWSLGVCCDLVVNSAHACAIRNGTRLAHACATRNSRERHEWSLTLARDMTQQHHGAVAAAWCLAALE
jgi:hypothetical protein